MKGRGELTRGSRAAVARALGQAQADGQTLHRAQEAYTDHLRQTYFAPGDEGRVSQHGVTCVTYVNILKEHHADIPLDCLRLTELTAMLTYWANRPKGKGQAGRRRHGTRHGPPAGEAALQPVEALIPAVPPLFLGLLPPGKQLLGPNPVGLGQPSAEPVGCVRETADGRQEPWQVLPHHPLVNDLEDRDACRAPVVPAADGLDRISYLLGRHDGDCCVVGLHGQGIIPRVWPGPVVCRYSIPYDPAARLR